MMVFYQMPVGLILAGFLVPCILDSMLLLSLAPSHPSGHDFSQRH